MEESFFNALEAVEDDAVLREMWIKESDIQKKAYIRAHMFRRREKRVETARMDDHLTSRHQAADSREEYDDVTDTPSDAAQPVDDHTPDPTPNSGVTDDNNAEVDTAAEGSDPPPAATLSEIAAMAAVCDHLQCLQPRQRPGSSLMVLHGSSGGNSEPSSACAVTPERDQSLADGEGGSTPPGQRSRGQSPVEGQDMTHERSVDKVDGVCSRLGDDSGVIGPPLLEELWHTSMEGVDLEIRDGEITVSLPFPSQDSQAPQSVAQIKWLFSVGEVPECIELSELVGHVGSGKVAELQNFMRNNFANVLNVSYGLFEDYKNRPVHCHTVLMSKKNEQPIKSVDDTDAPSGPINASCSKSQNAEEVDKKVGSKFVRSVYVTVLEGKTEANVITSTNRVDDIDVSLNGLPPDLDQLRNSLNTSWLLSATETEEIIRKVQTLANQLKVEFESNSASQRKMNPNAHNDCQKFNSQTLPRGVLKTTKSWEAKTLSRVMSQSSRGSLPTLSSAKSPAFISSGDVRCRVEAYENGCTNARKTINAIPLRSSRRTDFPSVKARAASWERPCEMSANVSNAKQPRSRASASQSPYRMTSNTRLATVKTPSGDLYPLPDNLDVNIGNSRVTITLKSRNGLDSHQLCIEYPLSTPTMSQIKRKLHAIRVRSASDLDAVVGSVNNELVEDSEEDQEMENGDHVFRRRRVIRVLSRSQQSLAGTRELSKRGSIQSTGHNIANRQTEPSKPKTSVAYKTNDSHNRCQGAVGVEMGSGRRTSSGPVRAPKKGPASTKFNDRNSSTDKQHTACARAGESRDETDSKREGWPKPSFPSITTRIFGGSSMREPPPKRKVGELVKRYESPERNTRQLARVCPQRLNNRPTRNKTLQQSRNRSSSGISGSPASQTLKEYSVDEGTIRDVVHTQKQVPSSVNTNHPDTPHKHKEKKKHVCVAPIVRYKPATLDSTDTPDTTDGTLAKSRNSVVKNLRSMFEEKIRHNSGSGASSNSKVTIDIKGVSHNPLSTMPQQGNLSNRSPIFRDRPKHFITITAPSDPIEQTDEKDSAAVANTAQKIVAQVLAQSVKHVSSISEAGNLAKFVPPELISGANRSQWDSVDKNAASLNDQLQVKRGGTLDDDINGGCEEVDIGGKRPSIFDDPDQPIPHGQELCLRPSEYFDISLDVVDKKSEAHQTKAHGEYNSMSAESRLVVDKAVIENAQSVDYQDSNSHMMHYAKKLRHDLDLNSVGLLRKLSFIQQNEGKLDVRSDLVPNTEARITSSLCHVASGDSSFDSTEEGSGGGNFPADGALNRWTSIDDGLNYATDHFDNARDSFSKGYSLSDVVVMRAETDPRCSGIMLSAGESACDQLSIDCVDHNESGGRSNAPYPGSCPQLQDPSSGFCAERQDSSPSVSPLPAYKLVTRLSKLRFNPETGIMDDVRSNCNVESSQDEGDGKRPDFSAIVQTPNSSDSAFNLVKYSNDDMMERSGDELCDNPTDLHSILSWEEPEQGGSTGSIGATSAEGVQRGNADIAAKKIVDIKEIDRVEDLRLLEEMMDHVESYEDRLKVRAQMRVVKQLIISGSASSSDKSAGAGCMSNSTHQEQQQLLLQPVEEDTEADFSSYSTEGSDQTVILGD